MADGRGKTILLFALREAAFVAVSRERVFYYKIERLVPTVR